MWQNLSLRTISHCRARAAWVCSSLTSERFFVCGWFRCWLSWAIVSGSEWSWWTQASSQELHYISPPAAEGYDSFTEQNSGFVTTTGHRATRHQAFCFCYLGCGTMIWIEWNIWQCLKWWRLQTADGSCADCFHTLSQEESDECSTRHQTRQGCYTIQNTRLGLQSRHTSYNKECLNLKIGDVRVWSFLHIASVCSGGFKCIYFFRVWLKAECAQTYGEARAGPVVPRLAPVERSGCQHCYQLVTNGQPQPNC